MISNQVKPCRDWLEIRNVSSIMRQLKLDCVMLKVTPEEVRWEGHIKHTDVRRETAAIPEEVASVRVGEVQQ